MSLEVVKGAFALAEPARLCATTFFVVFVFVAAPHEYVHWNGLVVSVPPVLKLPPMFGKTTSAMPDSGSLGAASNVKLPEFVPCAL